MTISYTDKGFSKATAQRATLSILLGVDSVVYGAIDGNGHLLHARFVTRLSGDTPGLSSILRRVETVDPALGYGYADTRIGVDSFYLTLTPQRLVEAGQDRLFLQQQTPLPDDLYIGHTVVGDGQLRLSYGFPAALKVWLDRRYATAAPLPFGAVLLDAAARLGPNTQRLHLHVQDQRAHLTFYDEAQLFYHNRFPFQTAKDFLYYTLLIYDQFDLDPNEVPIYLSGTVLPEGELYRLLYRYVRHLHLAAPPEGVSFGEDWNPTTAHVFYPLLAMLTA